MVKKISAIVLALVLCLTAVVVPVSAAGVELGDAQLAFALKWDKDYYKAGDKAVLSIYVDAADDLYLQAGNFLIGINSDVIDTSEITNATLKDGVPVTTDETFNSWYKAAESSLSLLTTESILEKLATANTAEENATYNFWIKFTAGKNTDGWHENTSNTKLGFPGSDFDPETPIATIEFTVRDDVIDDVAVVACIPTGSITMATPVQTSWKYFTKPGTATTTANIPTTAIDVSQAVASATVGEDPCPSGHTEVTVEENKVDATCTATGSYDEVVKCSVCNKEISREKKEIAIADHTAGTPVEENKVDATCTATGSYDEVVYCTVCNEEISRDAKTVDVVPHDYDAVVTDPTCTDKGYTTYTCTVCGDYYVADETEVVPHTPSEPVVEGDSNVTCGETGTYDEVVYCSVCNAELSRETKTQTVPHSPAAAVVENEVEATCTADGSYDTVVYCSVCNVELSRVNTVVPATGHTEAEAVVENKVDADCTNDGSYDTVVYCSVCGEEISRETTTIPAEGHKYDAVVTAPTCTEAGYTTYTCSVCGDTYTDDEVEALGHDYETTVTAPTCTEAGYTTYTCSVCEDTYTDDEVEALGHSYTDEVLRTATCTRTAIIKHTCSVCGYNYREETPAFDHKNADGSPATVPVPGKPATCTSTGLTDGEKCTLCQNMTVIQETIPTTDHGKDNPVVTKPTYSSQGYTTYTCNECGAVYDADYVPALTVSFTFEIAEPSVTELRARDTIILHPVFEGEVAEGVTVEWTVDNENFEIVEVYEDGSVKVEAKKVVRGTDGITTITATVVDADGNEITSDTVELTANAKFLQRLCGFFRVLFKRAANYEK